MTDFPDPADLYPDIAALGSLAAALQTNADDNGIHIGEVIANEKDPLLYAIVPSAVAGREGLGVCAGHLQRTWSIIGWGQGILLVSGSTETLADVVRAAHAWRDGMSLQDLKLLAPFVEITHRAYATEQGAAAVVEAEWLDLLHDARESAWPEYRELVHAAYAEPKLRQLYPFTSHWTLRFSTTTGFPFSPDVVCLDASRGGQFRVRQTWMGLLLGETSTAEHAVALAAHHLPAGIGPAISGPYPYPPD